MSYISNGGCLVDRCPRCRACDYLPLPELISLCHACVAECRRRWARQDDADRAVTKALRAGPCQARRGIASVMRA